jgi:hypothetical protein
MNSGRCPRVDYHSRPRKGLRVEGFLAEDIAIIPRWTTGVDREGAASLRYALIIASSIGPMRAMSKRVRTREGHGRRLR